MLRRWSPGTSIANNGPAANLLDGLVPAAVLLALPQICQASLSLCCSSQSPSTTSAHARDQWTWPV